VTIAHAASVIGEMLNIDGQIETRPFRSKPGLFAGILSAWLRSRPKLLTTWLHLSSRAIPVSLGARLALERRQ
jgi:hypothetical protein